MYSNPKVLLDDVKEAIGKILDYTKGMTYDNFTNDDKTIDAVIRNFEIIGEAVAKLPDSFTETHQQIDWFQMKGMRNRLVHDYRNVNLIIVWETIESDLPLLLARINKL